MKVTIIEGTPEELADYELRTGVIGQSSAPTPETGSAEEPLSTQDEPATSRLSAWYRSFIFGRARTPEIGEQVESYLERVLNLGGAKVTTGFSAASKDQRGDYLSIYDAGPQHYGAVARVSTVNSGLTLRLTMNDVADVADRIRPRNVQPSDPYQVNCPLRSADAIDLAVELTQRALDKVRNAREREPNDGGSSG